MTDSLYFECVIAAQGVNTVLPNGATAYTVVGLRNTLNGNHTVNWKKKTAALPEHSISVDALDCVVS